MMKLKPFIRPIFECKFNVLCKLAMNMCWRGFWGVQKFEKRIKNSEPFFPAFVMISLTDKCNYRCKGCWVSNSKTSLDFQKVSKIISAANKNGSYFFGLLGGEPLMYKDILKILEENPKSYFQIFTNGSLLDEDFAKKLAALGNATVLISLEGLAEESAARRGAKNAYQDAIKAMQNCKKSGLFWGVASSICATNFEELTSSKHSEFLSGLGAHYLWYYIFRPSGADPSHELALDESQITELRKRIISLRESADLVIIDAYWDDKGLAICPAASGMSHHISPSADLEFCPPIQFAKERIEDDSDVSKLFAQSAFLADLRKLAAETSRGCILLEDALKLKNFMLESGAYDTSGRGKILEELSNYPKHASHNMTEPIAEKGFVYRLLKKKYFFGFGAYG